MREIGFVLICVVFFSSRVEEYGGFMNANSRDVYIFYLTDRDVGLRKQKTREYQEFLV